MGAARKREPVVEVAEAVERPVRVVRARDGVREAKPGEKGVSRAEAAKRLRPVIVVGPDGKPKGTADTGKLLQGLLLREGVEAAVVGKRPRAKACDGCGAPITVCVGPGGERRFCEP